MTEDAIRKLSHAMKNALVTLRDGGGEGVIDRYGRLLVAGELQPFDMGTYLRLVSWGLVAGQNGRIRVTPSGICALLELKL